MVSLAQSSHRPPDVPLRDGIARVEGATAESAGDRHHHRHVGSGIRGEPRMRLDVVMRVPVAKLLPLDPVSPVTGGGRAPARGRVVHPVPDLLDGNAPYGLLMRLAAHTGLRSGELAVRPWRTHQPGQGDRRDARAALDSTHQRWLAPRHPEDGSGPANHVSPPRAPGRAVGVPGGPPPPRPPSTALCPERIPGSAGDPRGLDFNRQFDLGSVIRSCFKPALRDLGLIGVRWHGLRRHYATVTISQIAKGSEYTFYEARRWMAHARYQTTADAYGHSLETKPNVDVVNEIMRAGGHRTATPLEKLTTLA